MIQSIFTRDVMYLEQPCGVINTFTIWPKAVLISVFNKKSRMIATTHVAANEMGAYSMGNHGAKWFKYLLYICDL